MPIYIGYLFLGLACGILGQQGHIAPLEAFIMSILAYSGSGQFICIAMLMDNASLRYLDCNSTYIKSIDLSKCPKINTVDCSQCPYLKTVFLAKGQKLGVLRISDSVQIVYYE